MAEHFFGAFQIPGLARVDPALVKSMLGVPLVTDGHVGSSLIISPPCTFLSAPNIKLTTD